MLKLLALGALGYAGYKYYRKNSDRADASAADDRRLAVAGGPISDKATVQHTPPA
jgi:hypothetical protein